MTAESQIGRGVAAYHFGEATGRARRFSDPQDVIDAFDSDLEHTLAVVEEGGTTFLSPILGRLGGIICMRGTTRSHLAIVSREFVVPCLLSVELEAEISDGMELTMRSENGDAGVLVAVGNE